MDALFMAYSYFRRRKFEKCCDVCQKLLDKNPYDEAVWSLKMRAMTEQVYIDEVEVDEEGVAEMMMDDNAIAQVARPGTSLKKPTTATAGNGLSQAMRPTSVAGRPVSGFVRPGTQGGRPGTMEQAMKAPRTGTAARPMTSATGRHVRLGTASIVTSSDGPFINLARLNLPKYAKNPAVAKSLFEYIFHHENDIKNALSLASHATESAKYKDWWWKVQIGKCYYRLGMYREAEKQFNSALQQQQMIDTSLYLCKICTKFDQPLASLEVLERALSHFADDTSLLIGVARVHEALQDQEKASDAYKKVLHQDNMNVEAIASVATNYFYSDQPETALRFYRRLLQMGVYNAEIFNNIGLCCFYAQQYDMSLSCFQRAITMASDDIIADVWYNVGNVALGIGDSGLAHQAFHLALAHDNNHGESYNNLGVLEMRKGRAQQAQSLFQSATTLAPLMFEPHYNYALLADKIGDLQCSYNSISRSLEAFKDHNDSKDLLNKLKQQFSLI